MSEPVSFPNRLYDARMRLHQFEDHRFVGDKRTQVVYDLDAAEGHEAAIAALVESEQYLCFGPDTLAEARNRGYRLVSQISS